MNQKLASIRIGVVVVAVWIFSTIASQAQGIAAYATLTGVPGTGNTYNYTLILSNAPTATTSIEGFWYAWIPGHFFLPSAPTSPSGGSSGWTAAVNSNSSIQFQGTSANAIAPGGFATFFFTSSDSPATLTGTSQGFPIGDSVAYPGTINFSGSSPNEEFAVVSVLSVPEPSAICLLITGSLGLLAAGGRKLRV